MLRHVIDERRVEPQDDVITMLVESEIEEDGERHLLTDDEIYGFARLILTAGSGTTWRQLGILLVALLSDPAAARRGPRGPTSCCRRAIDEAVRWEPTDPIFRRLVTEDVELCGVEHPRRRGGRDGPRRRESRSRRAGTIPTDSIRTATRSRTSGSRAGPTSASACTWHAPRCSWP